VIRRGFTLVEVLISLVVLGVGVLGVISILPAAARVGAQVERGHAIGQELIGVVEALRRGARGAEARYADPFDSQPASVHMVFDHPVAREESPALNGAPWSSRACILLPHDRDAVFHYPRSGDPAQVAAQNGGGDPAAAEPAGPLPGDEDPALQELPTYPLGASEQRTYLSFSLRVQRAQVGEAPRTGLYTVSILFFSEAAGGGWRRLVETFTTRIAAGPGEVPPGSRVLPGAGQDWLRPHLLPGTGEPQ
jgi:prepilin-type N-terminal cleavage/methylation domain-containing protein